MRARVLVPAVAALTIALYLPRMLGMSALLPAFLTVARLDAAGSVTKLACLTAGAVFGVRVAWRLERGNSARLPWLLLGLWLGCFALGQGVLMTYSMVLAREAPLPSVGDIAFLAGYGFMLVAAWRFTFVYRASGFPVGAAREHAVIAAITGALLLGLAVPLLSPIADAPVPRAERMINLAYPALDLAALVPTVVMLRISRAFRPGKVWEVWGALLLGFVLMTGGDIFFAYFSSAKITSFAPVVDMMFVLGYLFAACGTKLQHEMVSA